MYKILTYLSERFFHVAIVSDHDYGLQERVRGSARNEYQGKRTLEVLQKLRYHPV